MLFNIFLNNIERLILILCLLTSLAGFSNNISIDNNENSFKIVSKSVDCFSFINTISVVNTKVIKTEKGNFLKLNVPSYSTTSISGNPELPVLKKLINVPSGVDKIDIRIINIEDTIIKLEDYGYNMYIFPKQPSVIKNSNDIQFFFNKSFYSKNQFNIENVVDTEILGIMRGNKLARVNISPFKYNPFTNEIQIITRIEVAVNFIDVDEELDKLNRQRFFSHSFESLFKNNINYIPINISDFITNYPVKYVIISDPMYQSSLQPLIEWKKKKGFIVIEEYTNNPLLGSSSDSIYSFLKDLYNNPVDGIVPTYLLLVGDEDQVPSFYVTTQGTSHVSDMYYCEFDGNGDFYPDMYYGRFSASNSLEVDNQVDKTLNHEKYLFNNPNFLENIVLVSGVDATWAAVHGNGQINYGTDYYFNSLHGHNVHSYLYGSGTSITSDMPIASDSIISDISKGFSFANYTAHCGVSGWSDPSFNIQDISNLQNNDKYGFIVGNCCQSNKFDANLCFGEKLLRENNKGAVGYIGATNNTYWDDDFWWAVGSTLNIVSNPSYIGTGLGFYDRLMHENGEIQQDWFFTAGQIIHSGNLAVTESGGLEKYYWEIYHLMGDPSLMPYIGVPSVLTATHLNSMPVGSSSLMVTTEENSYVALSNNGVLLDAKLVGPSGVVNLNFSQISQISNLDLVITKQFKQPYISNVNIINSNAPFITYYSHNLLDPLGNNNNKADYNELVELIIDFSNIGLQTANNVSIIVTENDPYISMIDSVCFFDSISNNNIVNNTSPFLFQVSNYLPDQHVSTFFIEIVDSSGNIWNTIFYDTLNSPSIKLVEYIIFDTILGNNNGKMEVGETLNLTIRVENSGNADVFNLVSNLNSVSSNVTINAINSNIDTLVSSSVASVSYEISIDANTPIGTVVDFDFNISDGTYSDIDIINEVIGIISEDYETGNFSKFLWNQGSFPWVINGNDPYEGNNCSRSALNLPGQEKSKLSINLNVISNGYISFYKKLSSEDGYDFLKFRIDSQLIGQWSGVDSDWSFCSFPVNIGNHKFEWSYEKDYAIDIGEDCAYLDYIIFPPIDLSVNYTNNKFMDYQIYPNPTLGTFKIDFPFLSYRKILIYDENGRIIHSDNYSSSFNFDISNESAGHYYIKIMPEEVIFNIIKN
tara:strand:+ start:28715 stop:32179 length:3465 start_codon:yes stop_codon:yes gene_type:complete